MKEEETRGFEAELQAAREIAVAAGRLLKRMSGRRPEIKFKGPVDLVTEADIESEKFIIGELRQRFPTHAVLSEEAAGSRPAADFLWLVDPLDGTTNYAHGFPIYTVSIGLTYRGEQVVGVVYDPNLDELFAAIRGGSATLNDQPISVSSISELDQALLATGFPYYLRQNPEHILRYFETLSLRAQGVRRAGAASIDLCAIACGRFDGYWELGLKPWDTAAAGLIVTEAGGRLTKLDGSRFDIWMPEVLATNGLLHNAMLDIIRSTGI